MKNIRTTRQAYKFRFPPNPVRHKCTDGVERVQHSVQIDSNVYDYAVNIARLQDKSVASVLSTLLEKAIAEEVENILKGLK